MLTGFSIRNFKNLAAVPPVEGELIPFGPINVLIGPNGSGKSSLLQAIDFLRAFLRSSVEVYLQERGWEANDLPNLRNTSKSIRWELTAELDADEEGCGAGVIIISSNFVRDGRSTSGKNSSNGRRRAVFR